MITHDSRLIGSFQVIDSRTNIPFDGLIGDDFFRKHNASINYENNSLKLKSVPYPLPLNRNTPQQSAHNITINPRCETIVPIKLKNPWNIAEGLVCGIKINDNLLMPNAIVKVDDNNHSFITIVNTSTFKQTIEIPELLLQPLSNQAYIYSLVADHSNNNPQNRINILNDNLRLQHLNDEERATINKICLDFNDIFHLPSDMLTRANTKPAEIPTVDNTPVHTKSYRLPHIYKNEVDKQIDNMLKNGIIKPSTSPWCSPIWVVPKNNDATGEKNLDS